MPTAPAHPTVPEGSPRHDRFRLWAYRATTAVLSLLMLVAVVDGLSLIDVFGPDQATHVASAGGYQLSVTAATVTRPALATPFEIRVRRAGGFDAPVELAIERDYLLLFDYQRMLPEPSGEHTAGDFTVLEFDPPDGDELVVSFDWRLEPAVQSGRDVTVAVVEGSRHVVEVESHLRVWP